MRLKYFIPAIFWICLSCFTVFEAWSCSVPVFRYALERWLPDTYKGVVIFQKEMAKNEQALFEQLKNITLDTDVSLNLQVQAVNTVSFSEEKLKGLLKDEVPEKLPVIAIWYPGHMGKTAPFLTASFEPSIVEAITHSPKRADIAKRLINGDAAVWIFVPSGDMEKDNQARSLLRKELDSAASRLDKSPKPVIPGYKGKSLSYGFSILPLSPIEPREKFFLETLLSSESDLHEHRDKPMVFPVFGRGRLLGALFGEYISKKNIQGAVSFITGACSCEVKALNPGTDLLIAAPWERAVLDFYSSGPALPELTGVMPEAPDSEIQFPPDSDEKRKNINLPLMFGFALVGILVLVGLLSMILIRRSRRD